MVAARLCCLADQYIIRRISIRSERIQLTIVEDLGDDGRLMHDEYTLLDGGDCDFIESYDFFESDWIKTGMKEERLIYRHFFNERQNKTLFYNAWWVQRKLGLERAIFGPGCRLVAGSLRRQRLDAGRGAARAAQAGDPHAL